MIRKELAHSCWQAMKWKCCQHNRQEKEKQFYSIVISTVKKEKMQREKMCIGIMCGVKEVIPVFIRLDGYLKNMGQSFPPLMQPRQLLILRMHLFISLLILTIKEIIQILTMWGQMM